MARLKVEVVYAAPGDQVIVTVELEPGATALDALRASGLAQRFGGAEPAGLMVGIFGHRVSPDTPVKEADRVELYRPLRIDPKEARRAKASARRRTKRTKEKTGDIRV